MSAAAVMAGLVSVPLLVLVLLEIPRWAVFAFALIVPFALLMLAAIRPQSLIAAVGAALVVGFLLIAGMGITPMSEPRVLLHLAAILCLAALLIQVIRGIADRRLGVLWILASLLLSVPIGYFAGGLIGFHNLAMYCNFPPLGPGVSSYLCSG
jgi:hypothetical protein